MVRAIFEATLTGSWLGNQWQTKFSYVGDGAVSGGSSVELAQAMGATSDALADGEFEAGTVLRAIQDFYPDGAALTGLTVFNVYSDADFLTMSFNIAGKRFAAGSYLPGYVTHGYVSNRVVRSIRPGTKRLSGLSTVDIDGNGNLAAATVSPRNLIASRLGAILSFFPAPLQEITFSPAVFSKEKYNPDPADPDTFAYRYYGTLDAQLERAAIGVKYTAYTNTRHQVTRQHGRGV